MFCKIFWFYFLLFSGFIYAVNPNANLMHEPSATIQSSKEDESKASTTNSFFNSSTFNSKQLYAEGALIYGFISDGGTSGVSVVETFNVKGEYDNQIFRPGPDFGFNAQVGYKFNQEGSKSAFLDVTFLRNYKNYVTQTEGYLINDISQLGNHEYTGFAAFKGPAVANDYVNLQYLGISLVLRRPWEEPNYKIFRFTKLTGLKYVRITKNFRGNILGNVYIDSSPLGGNDNTSPGQDTINYSADLNALGPLVGVEGVLFFTDKLKFKGFGSGSLMAGLASSRIHEVGTSNDPITIGLGKVKETSTYFSSRQDHAPQAWTPAFLEIGVSLIYDLKNKPNVSIQGGFIAAYILPTLSNGSYTQAVGGEGLVRLNDNLNMSIAFIKLAGNFD